MNTLALVEQFGVRRAKRIIDRVQMPRDFRRWTLVRRTVHTLHQELWVVVSETRTQNAQCYTHRYLAPTFLYANPMTQ